jgi:hypothetical protein
LINIIEKILAHTIKVNDGSGVLVQPADANYSYIVTAKHVISNGQEILTPQEISASTSVGVTIDIAHVLCDELDLAILVTSQRMDSELMKCVDAIYRDDAVVLAGYPATRRGSGNETRDFRGIISKVSGNLFTVEINAFPGHEDLDGVSGGGIHREINGDVFLCGILSGLEGNSVAEHHGKVECISVMQIDMLIGQHQLKPLIPTFLTCFSYSVPTSFKFDRVGSENNVQFARQTLHQFADDLRQNHLPNPLQILEKFENKLLIDSSPKQDIHNEKMWSAFLEFVVINAIVDKCSEVTVEYLEESSKSRRFLFTANKGNWQANLLNIFKSDLKGLKKGGVIIVSTGDYNGMHEISNNSLQNLVTNISRVHSKELKIDSGIKNPVREFRLHHLAGLHDLCVERKEDDYLKYGFGIENCEAQDLIEKLRSEYHAFIGE